MSLKELGRMLPRFHNEESGDIPVGPLLMIGLIVIPLVIGLIAFGEELMSWLGGRWEKVTESDPDMTFGQ